MNEATNPTIDILILNGVKYDINKLRNIPGAGKSPRIEVNRGEIVADINCSPMDTGLHALTTVRAPEGEEQKLGPNAVEYVSPLSDPLIVIKHQGKMLLLLGHATFKRSTKEVVPARLITTVAMKEKAKLHFVPPVTTPPPAPVREYPTEFKNAPRLQTHATPKPRQFNDRSVTSSNSNHPFRSNSSKTRTS